VPVQLPGVGHLRHLAQVHDGHPVRDVLHDREVVRDEEVGEVELRLQPLQQVDDLRLDGDVQRRDRLVADDEGRVHRQRPRDADALPLAARELVRVAVGEVGVHAHHPQQLLDALLALLAAREAVDVQGLAHDVAHGLPGVQRGEGILKDHRHLAAHTAHAAAGEPGQLLALELDRAGGRLQEADDRAAQRRLATARLADQAQGLALLDLQVDAVHGAHPGHRPLEDAGGDREVLLETANLDQRLG